MKLNGEIEVDGSMSEIVAFAREMNKSQYKENALETEAVPPSRRSIGKPFQTRNKVGLSQADMIAEVLRDIQPASGADVWEKLQSNSGFVSNAKNKRRLVSAILSTSAQFVKTDKGYVIKEKSLQSRHLATDVLPLTDEEDSS